MTENEPKKPVQMEGEPPPAPAPAEPPAATEGSEEDTGGEDGKVSKAAMVKVLKALLAMFTEEEPKAEEKPPEAPPANTAPTPAQVPGQALQKQESKTMNVEMAKLAGELEAMKAQLKERDLAEQRRGDVALALQRLDGRPLGADLEAKLTAFHAAHGGEAFKAHVDSMVATFAAHSGDARVGAGALGVTTPEVALAYQAQGIEAVNKATAFAAEHDELARRNLTRVTREDYVKLNMARIAARN